MQPFTSKELYMMNGGNKLYINKDGFGDIYKATAAEEAEWAREFIANTLVKIDTETNAVCLKYAIDILLFHKYPELKALLISKLNNASPLRQIVFATALWVNFKYEKSFEIILPHLTRDGAECLDQAFLALGEFKNNEAVKTFLFSCFQGEDDKLFMKAHQAITMWAWTGLPELRENNLLEVLKLAHKNQETFKTALKRLNQLLNKEA